MGRVFVLTFCDSPLVRAVVAAVVFNSFRTFTPETNNADVLALRALKSLFTTSPFVLLQVKPDILNCDPAGLNDKSNV